MTSSRKLACFIPCLGFLLGMLTLLPSARAIPLLITHGDTIADLGTSTDSANPGLTVAYRYSYVGVFWLDFWTWSGHYCLDDGNLTYTDLSEDDAAGLLGISKSQLKPPFNYRFPLGLLIFGAIVVGGTGISVLEKRVKGRVGKRIEDKANLGDVDAMRQLAMQYGGRKEYASARAWYTKAAAKGDVRSMFNLGVYNHFGHGGPPDYRQAVQWYLKAGEAGYADAFNNLASIYADGKLGAPDPRAAAQFYGKAAEKGSALGMRNYAKFLAAGTGVPQNKTLARQWYQKAADKGDQVSKDWLAANPG